MEAKFLIQCLVTWLLTTGLCTCAPPPENPLQVRMDARYQQSGKILSANLAQGGSHFPETVPTFNSQEMTALPHDSLHLFRSRSAGEPFSGKFSFRIPRNGRLNYSINLPLTPPFIDSIPTTWALDDAIQFKAGEIPLSDSENLLIFLEPVDPNQTPRKILIKGPTSTPIVSLPPSATQGIEAAKYDVYLVKQSVKRDTLPGLIYAAMGEYYTKSKQVTITH